MSITIEHKAQVIDLVKKKYAGWDGFDHQAFRRDEVNPKRSTVKRAQSLLGEKALAHYLVTRDTRAFIDSLLQVGQATPLLQRSGSANGDLEILYVPTLDKPVFCAQIYHLLHGTESVVDRLDAYFHYIEDHELPNTWTFPTYLLQFCYPEAEFFVEPHSTEWFLRYIGSDTMLGRPSAETYLKIKEYTHALKRIMAEFRPQDMIDIQSLIQVCCEVSEPALHTFSNGRTVHDETYSYRGKSYGEAFDSGEEENFWAESQPVDNDATMLYISEVSDESDAEISDLIDEASGGQEREFDNLFDQFKTFLTTYMSTPAGVAQAAAYGKARESAEQNFSHLIAKHELGEIVTDSVFLHLLPHSDTAENNEAGAWIHPGPSAETLLERLSQRYGNESNVRQQVAQVLLEFIRHCVYKTNALEKSTEALKRIDAISVIDVSSITPILHALKPSQYVLLHDTSISVINHFTGTPIHTRLQKLPELNAAALILVHSLRKEGLMARFQSVQPTDLFDIFCRWLARQERFNAAAELENLAPPAPLPTPAERIVSEYDRGARSRKGTEQEVTIEVQPTRRRTDATHPSRDESIVEVEGSVFEQCARECGLPADILERWHATLTRKGQMIFHGPAGTGKTYLASRFARALVQQGGDGIFKTILFHSNYTYADFVGDTTQQSGYFRAFCSEAAQKNGPCVLLIDEINRVDIAEVFGEMLYQLEYRDPDLTLANSNAFPVPENVYIIGTMRPRGEDSPFLDPVVRRRFALVSIPPDYDILLNFHAGSDFPVEELVRILTHINERIDDPALQIGITYFLIPDIAEHIEAVWRYEVEPCLEAAFTENPEQLDDFRWPEIKTHLML